MSPGKIKNRDSKFSLDAKRGFDGKTKIILFVFLFFVLLSFSLHAAAVVCTPQSAVLCAGVDDVADIYINGIYVATFGYVDVSLTGEVAPQCLTFTQAQLLTTYGLAPGNGNVIAVHDQNTECCEMWATWSMDITCTNGGHTYVDSDSGTGVDYFEDANTCCVAGQPPKSCDLGPSEGGITWYSPAYNENGTWTSASTIVYLGQEYGQKIFSFEYHSILPPLGFGSISTGCQQIFFRQGFNLNEMPTPAPPNLTITKTANKTLAVGPNDSISFTFHICNTGGGTTNTVGTIDQWTDTSSGWQYQGPWATLYGISYNGFYFGDIVEGAVNGPPAAPIDFNNGFPGVTCTGCPQPCFDFTWVLESWNIVSCITWYNSVTLTWTTGQASSVAGPISNFCSPTFTYTLTYTRTPTYTWSPTFTKTPTYTYTYTVTQTLTLSPQLTLTNTPPVTKTYTLTPTFTFTFTMTPTYTSTPPLQITLTKTISSNIVMLGSDVQYCLDYYNASSSGASINLWDTIPAVTTFVSCTGGCTTTIYGPNVVVSWSSLAVAGTTAGSVCFTVQVTSVPYLLDDRELFALFDDNVKYFVFTGKRLSLIEPEKRTCSMIEISRGSP